MTPGRLVWLSGRSAHVPSQILGIVLLEREIRHFGNCVVVAVEQPLVAVDDQLHDLIAQQVHSRVVQDNAYLRPLSVLEELAIDLDQPRQFYLFARFDRRFREHNRVTISIPLPNHDGPCVTERSLERAAVSLRRTLISSIPKAWGLDIITWENETADRQLTSPGYPPKHINVLRNGTTRLVHVDLSGSPLVAGVLSGLD